MTIFIDASALVAMIAKEPEALSFAEIVEQHERRLTSPTAIWEAARGVQSARGLDFSEARQLVTDFIATAGIAIVSIDAHTGTLALDAHQRFGRGVDPRAALNFGDCFAFACAVQHEAALLFKGADFTHTDITDATLA